MTVNELKEKLALNAIVMPDDHREISGCYIGDLLSWVMGAAKAGDIWITIMSNINIVAVATLCDTACILLAEGVLLSDEIINTAKEKGINILSSEKSAYILAKEISELKI